MIAPVNLSIMGALPANEFHSALPAELVDFGPEIGLVLGSGLGSIVERVDMEAELPYASVAGLPQPGVPGHAGRFVFGRLGDRRVVVAEGRSHLYEGHDAVRVAAGIRCLHALGVRKVVLTNAAGTANADFAPGNWMLINDQLNLTATSPLIGGGNFIDMSKIYCRRWLKRFREAAAGLGMTLHEGVYAGLLGPQYETPAEVRMVRVLGGDAIGMSTVLEAIQACALGMEVAGLSCLTNWASGMRPRELDHGEVMQVGAGAADSLLQLLERAL
jgi:purine-nucleoside phosphorylase